MSGRVSVPGPCVHPGAVCPSQGRVSILGPCVHPGATRTLCWHRAGVCGMFLQSWQRPVDPAMGMCLRIAKTLSGLKKKIEKKKIPTKKKRNG